MGLVDIGGSGEGQGQGLGYQWEGICGGGLKGRGLVGEGKGLGHQ